MPAVPSLILAAPSSGSGKTVLTLALLRHLKNCGVAVSSFKTGPDYIDPAFHAAATGRACFNLDGWAMDRPMRQAILEKTGQDADLVIGEGVMGLFDGAPDGRGSTADLAVDLDIPVVLVCDVRGQAASAAAVVQGFHSHRADLDLAGVIFNRVGGAGHVRALERAMHGLPVPIVGMVPRDGRLDLPDRHLGLVQAGEHSALEDFLDTAADLVGTHVDVTALRALAGKSDDSEDARLSFPVLGQRIAVAKDAAFAFAYPHVLTAWQEAGVELLPFSPLNDESPDTTADAVFLPGGYPELHAGQIASNAGFLDGLRAAAEQNAVVYGECGGYMVLGDGLTDADGNSHEMAGLLPVETSFAQRKLHLGYRSAALKLPYALGPPGAVFRGHEFHYSSTTNESPDGALFDVVDALGESLGACGLVRGSVAGSFMHLIAGLNIPA